MRTLDRTTALAAALAAVLLALAAACERVGADGASFYLVLAGVPVAAVGALGTVARFVDDGRGRLATALAGALVACLGVAAAARSPVFLDAGSGALAAGTVAAGLALAALLAAATLPLRR